MWPKRSDDDIAHCITTNALRQLDSNSDALAPAKLQEVERLARQYQFFHWELAFREVFENGGFDCVLGNPRWERVKLQEKEWFAERRPEVSDATNAAARKRMIQALKTDEPLLYRRFFDALRESEGWSHLMRNTGRYPFCGRGDINLYAVFAEAMRAILNDRGRAGCVLPTGIATDDTTKLFFQDVVNTNSLANLFDFENKGIFFPGVHRNYKFCLFTAGRGQRPTADRAEFVFFAQAIESLRDTERRFVLSPEDIALLNPNTRTCPIFRSGRDAELAKAIYRRVPVLIREAGDGQLEENAWGVRFSAMFHMANDSHLFRTREQLEADGGLLTGNVFHNGGVEHLPLYEAKMAHQFDHRWASYRVEGGKDVTADVPIEHKQEPGFSVLPRYWIEAREVHLRTANLPKDLLIALRNRNVERIAFAICHLLFLRWLHRDSGGSADAAIAKIFPNWIEFVAYHPFAREFAPTQMGLCGSNPACIQPLDPSYLPAEPIDVIKAGPRSSTAWHAVDPWAVKSSFASFAPYAELLDSASPLRSNDETLDFAEELLSRASPRWLMGWRDITRSVEKRTTIADVIPFAAVGDQLLLMFPGADARLAAALLGSLNSFVFDFVARQKLSGIHLKYFTMKQVTVLPPDAYSDADLSFMVPRVLELLYTGEDLRDFASECGWGGPPFRWDEERRVLLRCELDAAFFHLYLPADVNGDWRPARRADGCPVDETPEQITDLERHFPTPRDAVAYILDTFPGVRREDEAKHGEYRTKRVILEIYDAMREAMRTEKPYQTRLTPPPADPSCRHPPRAIAATVPVSIDLAGMSDGAWCRPGIDQAGEEAAVLAAVLKAVGAPVPIRRVRLVAALAMEPRLLTPSLSAEEAVHWRRLVGSEAEQLPAGVTPFPPRADHAGGRAVRHLRGSGHLVEDLDSGTWAPGSGLDVIHTEGWPDGRVGMVMRALHHRGDEEIIQTLPQSIREWVDVTAA